MIGLLNCPITHYPITTWQVNKSASLSNVQTNSEKKKFQKAQNTAFLGPKVLLFCLKNDPWTGNELAGNDVENYENSQLTLINISHLL